MTNLTTRNQCRSIPRIYGARSSRKKKLGGRKKKGKCQRGRKNNWRRESSMENLSRTSSSLLGGNSPSLSNSKGVSNRNKRISLN
jgi:hypothetical protein